ncbi:DinB family protein [Dongia rigui]|uniref:DinB family protein n=1 Tax=Dongia rigui TaxID=940149 RepID=A0ABU5E2M2_9PROT|nr:DinB family protein [Dongia rigui]MDY0873454.1 DinB family protein [Dongia rigui]
MDLLPHNLNTLRSFPSALRDLLSGIPAPALDWQPASWEGIPSESLTIRQQICHMRDIEADGYTQRFQRLLNENNPVLESIDGYALVEARQYDRTDLATALDAFEAARERTMVILDRLTPPDLARRGTFEGYGPVTVRGLVHFLCSHDQQHLAGIQWLLGMKDAA